MSIFCTEGYEQLVVQMGDRNVYIGGGISSEGYPFVDFSGGPVADENTKSVNAGEFRRVGPVALEFKNVQSLDVLLGILQNIKNEHFDQVTEQ